VLRPGVFVSVALADRSYDDVIRIPENALYGEDMVYVVDDGRLSPRQVEVLGYAGAELILKNAGDTPIQDGDQVVITKLREGGAGARVVLR